ncbi:MAG: deoxyribose-phosphate aldolase [Anaerolineae bacterium UTCFX2]|jgi:deoxyribose-phosphate aldolase|nr:deoxyribose-phosphate aldolase [Anaerolineae bacterium]MCZ7552200.1 deoxyribose-phosphate aldolase [Anaerolineales bacterium]OQY90540.1 MAG: deoxyribose-phosphate aldolase [Anaerolineae bacterium UTCFX2]
MESVKDRAAVIAKMIDHSLLHPALTDQELKAGCAEAVEYHVASACVKPCDVKQACRYLAGSDVVVCGVIGFPHGNSTIEIKALETEQILRDGAAEVDMVVNIGKVLSEDWDYISEEIRTIAEIVKQHGAILKVIFENDLLPDDRLKIRLCEICSECRVDFVKTSTGYNYVKGANNCYSYKGATEHDLTLMRRHSAPEVQIKAAGGVGNLDAILFVKELGVTRIGTKGTRLIVEEARRRFKNGSRAGG